MDHFKHPDFVKAMERLRHGANVVLNGEQLIGAKPKVGFVLIAYNMLGDDVVTAHITNDPSSQHVAAVLRGAAAQLDPLLLETRMRGLLAAVEGQAGCEDVEKALVAYLWPGKVGQ